VHHPHDTKSESHLNIDASNLYLTGGQVTHFWSINAVLAMNCRIGEKNSDAVMASAERSEAIIQINQAPIIDIISII